MMSHRPRFLNFDPSHGFQLYAHALVSKLMDLSPSDAASSSVIEKRGERYSCSLEIVSCVGRFTALCEAMDPRAALEEARRRVIRQLGRWRERRFFVGSVEPAPAG